MADRFLRRTAICEVVRRLVAKAVLDQQLISTGDRILIAASGGKDSTIMAWALASLKQALKIEYELTALHISSDFCNCCKKQVLAANLSTWDIPYVDVPVPIMGRLKPGRKMNCYWCSTQRRTELINYAVQNGYNKIALGHHLDDIIETFFMNLCSKGQLSTMPIKMAYDKYPVTLIRPLALLEERQIIECAKERDILQTSCTCPFGVNSNRKVMRQKIAVFCGGNSAEKRRIFEGVRSLVSSAE